MPDRKPRRRKRFKTGAGYDPEQLAEAREISRKVRMKAAQDRAEAVRPFVEPLVDRGDSLRQIAAQLNDANVPPPRRPWSADSVREVLQRVGLKTQHESIMCRLH